MSLEFVLEKQYHHHYRNQLTWVEHLLDARLNTSEFGYNLFFTILGGSHHN